MSDAFNLEAKIELNSKEYQKGLTEASKNFSAFGSKIKDGLAASAKVAAAGLATISAAAAASSAAVLKSVGAYTTLGDNVDKMSQKLNMSATAYQEWAAIMQHSGTSIDSMQSSMKTLANAVETGNEAFERLGITQEELAVMNNEQLFSRTITALQNVGNETERTYLAGQLLGRGATELGALLNTSAEDTERMRQRVHELGGVMSDEAVKASAKYKDSIQDLKTAFAGLGRGIVGDLVPSLTLASDGLTAILTGDDNGFDVFMEGFDQTLENIGKSAGKIKPIMKRLGDIAVKAIPEIIGTVSRGIVKAAPQILTTTSKAVAEMFSSFTLADLGPFNWVKEDAMRIVESVKEAFKGLDLEKLRGAFQNLGSSFNRAFEKVGDGLAWASENVISPLIEWAGNDLLPKAFDTVAGSVELLADAFEFIKEPAKRAWEVLQPYASGTLDVIAGTFDLISKAVGGLASEFSGVDWSGYWDDINNGEFFANWKSGWEDIVEWFAQHDKDIEEFFDVSEIGKSWREFWEDIGGSTYDTMQNWIAAFGLLKIGISEFADAWRVGADTIANAVGRVKTAINDFKDTWKLGEKSLEGLGEKAHDAVQDTIGGKIIDAIIAKIPAFADGGRVTQPTLALVGEKEPETMVPDSKRGEFGNVYNTNTFNINIDGTGKDAHQLAGELVEEMSARLRMLSIKEQRAVGGTGWL